MADWYEVDERTAVILASVNIGVIRLDERRSLLVDTGLDRDSGRRAIRMVAEAGWGTVAGILTTHAHADHIGGHATVVQRTGCEVWASPVEAALTRCPQLAPAILYGAEAPASLRGKFLLAEESPVRHVVTGDSLTIGDLTIAVVQLPGHSPDQIAYAVGDVCFAADVVLPIATIDKYRIPYVYSVARHRESLALARTMDYRAFVPGHGVVLARQPFTALIDHNSAALDAVKRSLVDALARHATPDEIVAAVLTRLGAEPPDLAALVLLRTTIMSVIADLTDQGLVAGNVEEGRLRWRLVDR